MEKTIITILIGIITLLIGIVVSLSGENSSEILLITFILVFLGVAIIVISVVGKLKKWF